MRQHFFGGMALFILGLCATVQASQETLLARGQYLAQAADCSACHRAPEPGGSDYGGGSAIATPFGIIYAPNITPSVKYGIGQYDETDFKRALTEGVRRDGSHLYPAMPYSAYRGMTETDIHALYVWFHTGVAPEHRPTPQTALPFPLSVRGLMALWNPLNANLPDPVTPLSTPQLQRGYYLVEVLGHCSACHSPRNLMMGEKQAQRFSGAMLSGWLAPNITADPLSGIGGWDDTELITYLRYGQVAGKGSASGGMAEAIDHSLRHLTHADLQSMVAYLRKIPAVKETGVTTPAWRYSGASSSVSDSPGKALYQASCATCHREDGRGAYDGSFPGLRHNTTTGGQHPANLVMVILDGVIRHNGSGSISMPGFRETLNDQEIAALATYVVQQFGNPEQSVSADFVASQRKAGNPAPWIAALPWITGIVLLVFICLLIMVIRRRRHAREVRK